LALKNERWFQTRADKISQRPHRKPGSVPECLDTLWGRIGSHRRGRGPWQKWRKWGRSGAGRGGSRNNYAQTAPLKSLYFQGRGPRDDYYGTRGEVGWGKGVEKSHGYKHTTLSYSPSFLGPRARGRGWGGAGVVVGSLGGLGPGGSSGRTFFPPFLDFICTPCALALPRRQSPKFFAQRS